MNNIVLSDDDSLNTKIKQYFVNNILFGQKLINGLSEGKTKEVNINYFLSHIKQFNDQLNENWNEKINFKKYESLIPHNIHEKLGDEPIVSLRYKNSGIEPYCKKQIKLYSPINLFKKIGFHYKLLRLESQYYDLVGLLYYDEKIVGYICCGKKSRKIYKNIYIVINQKYPSNFYENKRKKLSIINDIEEDIEFYESEAYHCYLENYRNVLYTVIFELLHEYRLIKNIICIGEEFGGNILQLFMVDLLYNRNDIGTILEHDLSYHLCTYNTAMLSTESFYDDLCSFLSKSSNLMLTCFSHKNNAHDTWETIDSKKCNLIVLS